MNRREFIVSTGAASSIGIFSGCLGSGTGSNNNSNGSGSNGSGGGEETTVNPKNVIKRVTFDGGTMFVHVGENVRRVRLYNPNGQKFGAKKVGKGESSAKFTLITKTSSGTYSGYKTGTWKARADWKNNGEYQEVVRRNLNLKSDVKATSLRNTGSGSAENRQTMLTLENSGTAPAVIQGARLSAEGHEPTSGTTSMVKNPIVAPDSSIEVGVSYIGFGEQFALKEGQKPSDVGSKYCSGKTVPATIEIQQAGGTTRTHTHQLTFTGKPIRRTDDSVMCTNVSLQSGSATSSSTTSS